MRTHSDLHPLNQLPPSLLVAPSKMKIRTYLPPYLLLYLLMISLPPSLPPLPPRTFLPLLHLLWLLRMSLSLWHLLHWGQSKELQLSSIWMCLSINMYYCNCVSTAVCISWNTPLRDLGLYTHLKPKAGVCIAQEGWGCVYCQDHAFLWSRCSHSCSEISCAEQCCGLWCVHTIKGNTWNQAIYSSSTNQMSAL